MDGKIDLEYADNAIIPPITTNDSFTKDKRLKRKSKKRLSKSNPIELTQKNDNDTKKSKENNLKTDEEIKTSEGEIHVKEKKEYDFLEVLKSYSNNIKDKDYLTLPECIAPKTPEYKKTEDVFKQTIQAKNTSHTLYSAMLDCLEKHCDEDIGNNDNISSKDMNTLYKVLQSLRKATILISTTTKDNNQHLHAQLIHYIFKLTSTHTTPKSIKTPIDIKNKLESFVKSQVSEKTKSVIRHKLDLLKENKLKELQDDEKHRVKAFEMYYQKDDLKLLLVHLHLIVELVSSNYIFIRPALSFLFRIFWSMDVYDCDYDMKKHSKIHLIHCCIGTLLKMTPMMNTDDITSIIQEIYPHYDLNNKYRVTYFTLHCLIVLLYSPYFLHEKVLKIIYSRCTQWDIEIKIDDKSEDGASNDTAEKLDILMELVLEFHKRKSFTNCMEIHKSYHNLILPIFESSIINSYKCKYVPFILFIVCGDFYTLRGDELKGENQGQKGEGKGFNHAPDALYRHLCSTFLRVVLDNKRPSQERHIYMYYLSSFLSRANYVDAKTICETVAALLHWILSVYKADTTSSSKEQDSHPIHLHSLFYTICQCTFHIMCYRWEEVLHYFNSAVSYNDEEEHDGDAYYPPITDIDIQPKKWEDVCAHPLNPLKFTSLEHIRKNFIQLAKNLELVPEDVLNKVNDSLKEVPTASNKRKRLSGGNTPLKKKKRKSSIGNIITTSATAQIKQKLQESFSTLNFSSAASKSQGITNTGSSTAGVYQPTLQSHFPFDNPFLLKQCYVKYIEKYYRQWEEVPEDNDVEDS